MTKHSFQEFFPIISPFFFWLLAISRLQKPKTRDNHLFQLKKKKGFKEFHSSFLSFFGVAAIFRLQREHSCYCVLTDTSLWSLRIYTEFYLRTLWFHDHIKHQKTKKTKIQQYQCFKHSICMLFMLL